MSVMRLSPAHFAAVATWCAAHAGKTDSVPLAGGWETARTSLIPIAETLDRANAANFAAAYGEECPPHRGFGPLPAAARLPAGQVWELLSCIEYNSDNLPGWAESDAARMVRALQRIIAKQLPGARRAVWSVEDAGHVSRLADSFAVGSRPLV